MKVRLRPDETAIVGYGSLLSAASISRTIDRPYDGPFVHCHLDGWRRSWNVSMPNQAFYFVRGVERIYPRRILYLNTRPDPSTAMNAVLFVLRGDELRAMREREWIYRETVVTTALRGVEIEGGEAVMYVGLEEHLVRGATRCEDAAIRASYLRIVDAALESTPPEFRDEYAATTDTLPRELVIDDVLDRDRPSPWAGSSYRPERQIES